MKWLNQAQCGNIVTLIVKQNEQLAGFTQLLEVEVSSTGKLEGFTGGPSQAQEEWQELQPSLEGWVGWRSWWFGGDLSSLKKQVEQAEATFGAKTVLKMVMKSLFLSFNKQRKGVLQSPSSLPDYSFFFSTKLPHKGPPPQC